MSEARRTGEASVSVPVPASEAIQIACEYLHSERLDDAHRLLSYVLAAAPCESEALHMAAIIAIRKRQFEEACVLIERAIEHGIETQPYWCNLSEVYRRLGRLDDAVIAGERAVAAASADPFSLHNMGVIHRERLDLDLALHYADRALELDPGIAGSHFTRADVLLVAGRLREGWEEYEWRYRLAGVPRYMPETDKPQWDGRADPNLTLMLVAEQGIGDVLQFSRYIPWAASRCSKLVIAAMPEVKSLLERLAPEAEFFVNWDHCPAYDEFCPLSGLPRVHGTTLDNIPSPPNCLRAQPKLVEQWAEKLRWLVPNGYKRIGIIWAGRADHSNDSNRSATLEDFAPLTAMPGVALLALQKGQRTEHVGEYFGRAPLINLGAEINDLEDTMAILENLDLLVSVDSGMAHLAGSMGRPVWIMLPHSPDWRWLLDRADSPWYPTVRLFRQTTPKQWTDVAESITKELRRIFGDQSKAALCA
jgi:Tfp pilus assembly protein PilF